MNSVMANVQKITQNIVYTIIISNLFVLDALAGGGGLSRTKTALEGFRGQLLTIVPIIAIIALILFGIAYGMKIVDKDTFIRWAVGLLVAGSASQIVKMFFSANGG